MRCYTAVSSCPFLFDSVATCRLLRDFLSLIIIILNVHFARFSFDMWDALLLSGLSALQAEQGDPATRRVKELLIYLVVKLN